MSYVIGAVENHIETGYLTDDTTAEFSTIFGLPGSGGFWARDFHADINVVTVIDNNLGVYVAVNGGRIDQLSVNLDGTESYLSINKTPFTPDVGRSYGVVFSDFWLNGSGFGTAWCDFGSVVVPNYGDPIPGGYTYFCQLTDLDWHFDEPEVYATAHIGGTEYGYTPVDPVYPESHEVKIRGIYGYLNFFPCAIYSGGYKSCNRSGGNFQMYNSGWLDKKNKYDTGSGDNSCQRYTGSEWLGTEKVGAE